MKIGIITQPLAINYGGLLQNYALQQVLIRMGHEVYTIDRCIPHINNAAWHSIAMWKIKQNIKKLIGKPYTNTSIPTGKKFRKIRECCSEFTNKHIKTTEGFFIQKELHDIINKYRFEGFVVGSDQVWRPIYSLNIYNDFLDFCQDKKNIKRIAYAASFGVDNWEFNEEQSKECSRLAKMFDAISVREESGIKLCKDNLGVDAQHVLDPTLLLEKEDYIKLAELNNENISDGNLFCYILDSNESIAKAINNIEDKVSLKSFQVKARKQQSQYKKRDNIEDYVIPSPTKWIRAFMDAKMVFTDSFHGCVFSIIFNKPFWVIGNKERGNARFDSLLKLFNLENRRITLDEINNTDLRSPIDWNSVNAIKKEWQNKSIEFIKENL